MNKMEDQQHEGQWWIPGSGEDEIGGVAEYRPNSGTRLRLFGSFAQDRDIDSSTPPPHRDMLYGRTRGEHITLIDCRRTQLSVSSEGSSSGYRARYMITGGYLKSANKPFAETLSIRYPLLDEWGLLTAPPKVCGDWGSGHPGSISCIVYENPESLTASLPNMDVRLGIDWNVNRKRTGNANVTMNSTFVFEPHEPLTIEECIDVEQWIRGLLTVATDTPTQPTEMKARADTDSQNIRLQIYSPFVVSTRTVGNIHPYNMNFQLPDVQFSFAELIEEWDSLWSELDRILRLFLGTKYSSGMYSENEFLSLIQAIEGYHRRAYIGRYMSDFKYERIVKENLKEFTSGDTSNIYNNSGMTFGVDPSTDPANGLKTLDEAVNLYDFTDRFLPGLEHMNEYSLRRRIKQLVDDYEHILKDIPYNITEDNRIHKIVETRHAFAHQLQNTNPAVAEGDDLVKVIWALRQLYTTILLKHLGVPNNQIVFRLQRRYAGQQ